MVKEPRITLKPQLHNELLRIQKRSTFGSVSALVQYILTRYVENYGDTSIYGSYIPHKDKPDEGDKNDENSKRKRRI